MIRNDLNDITENEFKKIMIPEKNKIRKYVVDNLLHEYVAFRIATLFNMDAMWTSNLSQEINSALDDLSSYCTEKLNTDLIKLLLEKRYELKIINDKPLEIKNM